MEVGEEVRGQQPLPSPHGGGSQSLPRTFCAKRLYQEGRQSAMRGWNVGALEDGSCYLPCRETGSPGCPLAIHSGARLGDAPRSFLMRLKP